MWVSFFSVPFLRICFLTTSFPRTSDDYTSIFLQRLATALRRAGERLAVIVPRDKLEPLRTRQSGLAIVRFNYDLFKMGGVAYGAGLLPNIQRNPLRLFQLPLLLLGMIWQGFRLRKKIDVFHAHWILAAFAGYILRLLTGKPYILSLLGSDMIFVQNRKLRRLFAPVLHRASGVIVVSKHFAAQIATLYQLPQSRLAYIPMGIEAPRSFTKQDLEEFLKMNGLPFTARYLLCAATLIPLKGQLLCIEALIQPGLADVHLLLCGKLNDQHYVEQIRKTVGVLDLTDRVHLLGAQAPERMPYFFALSSCYVSASSSEGKPNAVLEAMAYGMPVVLSDIPAHRELLIENSEGTTMGVQLFERGNAVELGRKLATALAQEKVEFAPLPSWESCAAEHQKLYQAAVTAGSAPLASAAVDLK